MGSHINRVEWSSYTSFTLLAVLAVGLVATSQAISTTSAGWWAVGVTACGKQTIDPGEVCPSCANFRGNNTITERQERICRDDHGAFLSLSAGARQAIIACQEKFNNSHWNCSTLYGEHLFGSFVANGQVRETGVLNAFFTVGAISGVSEGCHEQRIEDCPCIVEHTRIEDENGNIEFESCRADYTFAEQYLNRFYVDQIDDEAFGGQIDIHNVDVGKQLVNVEEESCRCHGVSGTCTVQTCYKRLPSVSELSAVLFSRYGGAIRVNKSVDGGIVNVIETQDPPSNTDLIYKDLSPNFCELNLDIGTVGVKNRRCNPNIGHPDSCNLLCCGRGHYSNTKRVPIETCAFVWCCRIECLIEGYEDKTEYFCN